MLSTMVMIEVSIVYLQCSVPCHVNLLACAVFKNICVPFFLHKLTSISRQNWSCEEIPSSQNSDKAASFSSVVVNKNIASSYLLKLPFYVLIKPVWNNWHLILLTTRTSILFACLFVCCFLRTKVTQYYNHSLDPTTVEKYYFHYLPPVLNPDPNLAANLFTSCSFAEAVAPTAAWACGTPALSKRKLHNHGTN